MLHRSRILIAPPLPRIKHGAGASIPTQRAKPSGDASREQAGNGLGRQTMGRQEQSAIQTNRQIAGGKSGDAQ
jgi:hypothetical protein